MILSQQFLARVFRNLAELVIHFRDSAFRIRDCHDSVLVKGCLQVHDFL